MFFILLTFALDVGKLVVERIAHTNSHIKIGDFMDGSVMAVHKGKA